MGLAFGKIKVETPKFDVIKSTEDYEIRKYSPCIAAEITYSPSDFNGDKDGGFKVLADYIGVFGTPKNKNPEKIAMTTPVLTKSAPENISMTVPVLTKLAPENKETVTMQFLLPAKYTQVEAVPAPVDERVVIKEVGERKYGVLRFNGDATDKIVNEKVEMLKKGLAKDGFNETGDFVLARFNPTWIINRFKTSEVMIPVQ